MQVGYLVNSLVLYLVTSRLNIYYLVSVVIATVASTLWNFSLTEYWVYRAAHHPEGRLRRFALFSVMNLAALALRTPIIIVLTALFNVHYVVSNLISLILLTGLRFLTADNMIWGQMTSTAASSRQSYSYNIHDLVTVVSEGELPELEPFRVLQEIEQPTISVKIGIPPAQKSNGSKDPELSSLP